ncbi:MAG TPA: riboflavin biosynthesis protein RibF [Candidatus Limnocylindria bacterium]|nr:riboflavin biosynthesis protein RibF [Candidatus Limnocylindria bacterium]
MSDEIHAVALADLPPTGRAVVTLGVFDGVHLGHRALLEATRDAAADGGMTSAALVFDPPPEEVLRPGTRVARLAPIRLNIRRIEALGVERVIPIRFDESVRALTAEAFLAALSPALVLGGLAISPRSAFGRDRGGTADRMQQLGAERGFQVRLVAPVEVDGEPVSSTRIRGAIADGDVEAARALGVVPYLEGIVVIGDRRGRELGFPTANLRFEYLPAMPSLGIYAGRVTEAGSQVAAGHPALISIGTRPTFHDGAEVLAEVHLLDFDGDLYGLRLGVELLARLRDEQRFADADALVAQMQRDAERGRAVLGMS